jgi:hypothetical protein
MELAAFDLQFSDSYRISKNQTKIIYRTDASFEFTCSLRRRHLRFKLKDEKDLDQQNQDMDLRIRDPHKKICLINNFNII